MKAAFLKIISLVLFFFAALSGLQAQSTVISGKVVDAETSEPMPFVNVFFTGTSVGTTTDFDGFFKLSVKKIPSDSLTASYVGYESRYFAVKAGKTQEYTFRLPAASTKLREVVITGDGENPAWEIMREVIRRKPENDAMQAEAFECERYTRIELDIDNISESFRKKKAIRAIVSALDSMQKILGEDGKPVLPVFVSENISEFYFQKNPEKIYERILKTKTTGVGIDDGDMLSQFVAAIFREYNFYENWLKIGNKDLISPIADSWKTYYDYKLEYDFPEIDGEPCVRISFKPKRAQDLAFEGSIWISDSTYALKRIDVTLGASANLNYIEKIKIQQELKAIGKDNRHIPIKTRILIDIGQVKDDWAGMLAKYYSSHRNFVTDKKHPAEFYSQNVTLAEDALQHTEKYWTENRHDSLSSDEKKVYAVIDTIKNLPMIKTYVQVLDVLVNGHKKVGKVDIGPYLFVYGRNNIEGNRFRLGFRTNSDFSNRISFNAYGAYGTLDKQFKYQVGLDYVVSRSTWTRVGMSRKYDLNQVALFGDGFDNPQLDFLQNNALFRAFTFWGNVKGRRPFMHTINSMYLESEILRNVMQKITFTSQQIDPIFNLSYFDPNDGRTVRHAFKTSELTFETLYTPKARHLQRGNVRMNLGSQNHPMVLFRYTLGLKNFLGGDYAYHKFLLKVLQNARLGGWGRSSYVLTFGYTPTVLPYPLLEPHLGNESPFFNRFSYNQMNFFEFISDRYAALNLTHHFDGAIFNRLPLIRRLKWRELVSCNVLYGNVSDSNLNLIPAKDDLGNDVPRFATLNREPYIEIGYGVENIFKFLRITAFHRLNYLDLPNARPFGIKASVHFKL